ncbi:CDP-alcohol phosphatidyltransferase family protein [Kamptonema cortianum]|nr:CDP-alcohol phosphatidyltransferase family protein [Kamptonema cortianum]
MSDSHAMFIPGECLPDIATIQAVQAGAAAIPVRPTDPDRALRDAAEVILRNTGKPTDGLISRYCNRPLSRAASKALLRLAWFRPGHASLLTLLAAMAMFASLLTGTQGGLLVGAVFFQVASVVDGIDGEIARATFRSSKLGASLDSVIDAFTNVAFLTGVAYYYHANGPEYAAGLAIWSSVIMASGLVILGVFGFHRDGVIHFDGAKGVHEVSARPVGKIFKHLTGRDFYCSAFLIATLFKALEIFLIIFFIFLLTWFIAIQWLLATRRLAARQVRQGKT